MSTQVHLPNTLIDRYEEDYIQAAMRGRLYDQFAVAASADKDVLEKASTVILNFLSDMKISEQTISQTGDVNPQTLSDATVSISGTSRTDAIYDSEKLLIQAYTPYAAARYEKIGLNMMETVDLLAQTEMLTGALIDRAAARASLDAGTAGHRLSDADLAKVESRLAALRVPNFIDGSDGAHGTPKWIALMGTECYYDLRSGGNLVTIANYQNSRILLNNELAQIGQFRIVVDAYAKKFLAAGAANGTAVDTTVATAAEALDKTVVVAADTNIAAGQRMLVGVTETADTHQAMNEFVEVVSISGTTVTIVGEGANGGLRFDHAVGAEFTNADSVYTVAYGGPMSMAKVYASSIGEYGQVVGPKLYGLADTFTSLAWKWYGGYGTISEAWKLRGEYSSSMDA